LDAVTSARSSGISANKVKIYYLSLFCGDSPPRLLLRPAVAARGGVAVAEFPVVGEVAGGIPRLSHIGTAASDR
jgi:hypothetical protein